MNINDSEGTSRQLKKLGLILFLLGLITGFTIMGLKNPRMGLAAHLEGVMNGSFLIIAGVLWNEFSLPLISKKILYFSIIIGTFLNWSATLLAAILGTSSMTPISGAGYLGSPIQEILINIALIIVGLSMITALLLMIYGMRSKITK